MDIRLVATIHNRLYFRVYSLFSFMCSTIRSSPVVVSLLCTQLLLYISTNEKIRCFWSFHRHDCERKTRKCRALPGLRLLYCCKSLWSQGHWLLGCTALNLNPEMVACLLAGVVLRTLSYCNPQDFLHRLALPWSIQLLVLSARLPVSACCSSVLDAHAEPICASYPARDTIWQRFTIDRSNWFVLAPGLLEWWARWRNGSGWVHNLATKSAPPGILTPKQNKDSADPWCQQSKKQASVCRPFPVQ